MRALLVALALTMSLLVAVVAGVLSWADDRNVPSAILYGGGAFLAWMTLCVTLCAALGLFERNAPSH